MLNYRHIEMGEVGSTNDEAIALARLGDKGNVWITATSQTSGKARRGRSWVSKTGNLYASLLLVDYEKENDAMLLPLLASVALYDSVAKLITKKLSLAIKWPNDLLLANKKLSGILLEKGENWIVVGFGVNCRHYPVGVEYAATSLWHEGFKISSVDIFAELFKTMALYLQKFQDGVELRKNWLARCAGLGSPIQVRLHKKNLCGIFENLDSQGRLILQTSKGRKYISAGDVFFER